MPVSQRINITILLLVILTGCASLPEEIKHPIETLSTHSPGTLSTLVEHYQSKQYQPKESEQEMSAVLVQDSGWDALAQRLALIESAEHSIDIQYYIWNSDASGHYLASRLIAAADRGV